jgi:hypothetical protein
MSRAFELTLGGLFTQIAKVYVHSFPLAYATYKRMDPEFVLADITSPLADYKKTIESNRDAIFRVAAADINRYLSNYSVHANQSADEFKIIYFMGRAIERHLVKEGFPEHARAHLFVMIGLLDYRLQTLGVMKPKLTKALTKLIKLNAFDQELGANGCYLTYKCVATVKLEKL